MLVNWSGKLGQVFGGQKGRILRILLLFLCSLGILVGIYRARGARIEKEQLEKNKPLKHTATSLSTVSTPQRWVIVANPGEGEEYVCSLSRVAKDSAWKTIIIGEKVECCRMPECYSIHPNQFLRMSYRTASTLKNILDQNPQHNNATAYREVVRNLAYIWVIHRGARNIFDAYVDEYIAANVTIPKFEEELSRQLHTLALDESLALVEDKTRSPRHAGYRNPYGHFGRPDVKLIPNSGGQGQHGQPQSYAHLAHRHTSLSTHPYEFPSFRICEVRPPSIEKFLEIDGGWWDLRAPSLVLPGDTMPPLCTRNTLFSPDVFWALPILPDYAGKEEAEDEIKYGSSPLDANASSRIPPWYIRGLWSQSLLGDLGGSIRVTLNRVPTLQLNQNYFTGGDYEPSSPHPLASKLLKRWHCKSRSTFRCLMLMAKELSKSVYLGKNDLALIEAWIIDLKSIHYAEPPMLPRRRSHTNPCLGADGLHGVSFFPALQPNPALRSEENVSKRNETLKHLVSEADKLRTKRESRMWELSPDLIPPEEKSTYFSTDWSAYPTTTQPSLMYSSEDREGLTSHSGPITYYTHYRDAFKGLDSSPSEFVKTLVNHSKNKAAALAEMKKMQQQGSNVPEGLSSSNRGAKLLPPPVVPSEYQEEEFPILTAMAENMCPGFGPLIPFQPSSQYEDILLIVVFSNQHYDLIPTLEVLYRPIFPNMLYCGHPHVSVDLFLRKYQSAEGRSFSFLPTYTRATYECVLGAMEMNYEVRGNLIITDETLMKSWNIKGLDKSKIWVSSSSGSTSSHDSRHVPVTKSTWKNLDPRGQKLPRLLDGVISAWKLFSYILVGHDGFIMDHHNKGNIKKRSVDELETGESSYVPNTSDDYVNGELFGKKPGNSLKTNGENKDKNWEDLPHSDWDQGQRQATNETDSDIENEEAVEVGEEDETSSKGVYDLLSTGSPTTLSPSSSNSEASVTDESDSVILATPPPIPDMDNISSLNQGGIDGASPKSNNDEQDNNSGVSTTPSPDGSVGVPLYHVEHIEPPTPSTWHRPDEEYGASTTSSPTTTLNSVGNPQDEKSLDASEKPKSEEELEKSSSNNYSQGSATHSDPAVTPIPNITVSSSPTNQQNQSSPELEREIEHLLDLVQEVYLNMLQVVAEYKESNESKPHEFSSSEGLESRFLLEDTKSHRISPREFRHIRCTLHDDGHQSELCSALRTFISTLGQNVGTELELDYDTIPMYYLPSWATKSFYSVANVLLHFGVLDELALPILFRGLALDNEWVSLKRSPALKVTSSFEEAQSAEADDTSPSHFFHPFNLHKVYGDADKRKLFCSNYLLKVFQM